MGVVLMGVVLAGVVQMTLAADLADIPNLYTARNCADYAGWPSMRSGIVRMVPARQNA
jgi:hypothetical protein